MTEKSRTDETSSAARPPRPVGVALAIIASVFLFSCFPLTRAVVLLSLASRTGVEFAEPGTASETTPAMTGSQILGLETGPLFIELVIALGFLVIAVVAWRGRPSIIRFVFVAAVLALSAGNLILLFTALSTPASFAAGMDSGAEIGRSIALSQLCVSVGIPLYVVWYMNRGPARAFFRGSYRASPDEAVKRIEKPVSSTH